MFGGEESALAAVSVAESIRSAISYSEIARRRSPHAAPKSLRERGAGSGFVAFAANASHGDVFGRASATSKRLDAGTKARAGGATTLRPGNRGQRITALGFFAAHGFFAIHLGGRHSIPRSVGVTVHSSTRDPMWDCENLQEVHSR
jgi:hypothetical protein